MQLEPRYLGYYKEGSRTRTRTRTRTIPTAKQLASRGFLRNASSRETTLRCHYAARCRDIVSRGGYAATKAQRNGSATAPRQRCARGVDVSRWSAFGHSLRRIAPGT